MPRNSGSPPPAKKLKVMEDSSCLVKTREEASELVVRFAVEDIADHLDGWTGHLDIPNQCLLSSVFSATAEWRAGEETWQLAGEEGSEEMEVAPTETSPPPEDSIQATQAGVERARTDCGAGDTQAGEETEETVVDHTMTNPCTGATAQAMESEEGDGESAAQAGSSCSLPSLQEEFPIHYACFQGDVTKLRKLLYLNEPQKLMQNFAYLSRQLITRASILVPRGKVLLGNKRTWPRQSTSKSSGDEFNPSEQKQDSSDSFAADQDDPDEVASVRSLLATSLEGVEGADEDEDTAAENCNDSPDDWVSLEGCPAELAVRGGQYLCARVALSMMLLIRIKHAGWAEGGFSTFRNAMHSGFSILHMKIGSNEGSSFIATLPFLDFQLEPSGIEALKVLLAACLLGLVQVVEAVIEMQTKDFWEQRFPGPYHNWITNAESTLLAAATGGDAHCLRLVLATFREDIRLHLISSIEDAILNVLWGWKVAEMKDCLQQLKQLFPQARHARLPLTTFVDAIAYTGSWLSYGSPDATLLCYRETLPTSNSIFTNMCDVMQIYQTKWAERWDYEASSAIIATWNAGKVKSKLKDHPDLEGMLESFICQILTWCNREVPGSILLDKDLLYFLCLRKVDYRKGFLLTVCQCWYVTRDRTPRVCPMCHPLVSFVLYAAYEACYWYLMVDGLLSTMASCFSLQEIAHALQLLEMPRKEGDWCHAHRTHPGRNFLGTLHHSAPKVLKMLEECLEENCLQHMAVQTILDSLEGDCSRIKTKEIPGPLMRYFAIDQFLQKW